MIGDRLKEERKRVGLTQPELAEVAGAAKRTVIDWEKGVSSPTAAQLAALACRGLNVLYVVTGQHAQGVTDESYVATSQHMTHQSRLVRADLSRRKARSALYMPKPPAELPWERKHLSPSR